MRINNNIMAMNTFRQYSINSSNVAGSTEKLSSGYRINRAGDDAAGLAISEKMRAQIKGLNMASKNSEDAISLVQTAEGALTETHSILQRMRELSVQASSDTNENGVDRSALNEEFTALRDEINDIATKTAFNGKKLLNGSLGATVAIDGAQDIKPGALGVTDIKVEGFDAGAFSIAFSNGGVNGAAYTATLGGGGPVLSLAQPAAGGGTVNLDFGNGRKVSITMASHAADAFGSADLGFTVAGGNAVIQTGADKGDKLTIDIDSMKASDLGLEAAGVDLTSQPNASNTIDVVNTAINTVSTQRSKLGAMQNRLQHKINNLDTSSENLSAAESRIRDLDMAKEMTTHTKNNILVQAATAMLAQANAAPQGVLQLLQ